jgi:hypothetical protein
MVVLADCAPPLGDLFQGALFGRNEPSHVAAQEQDIGEPADESEGRLPLDDVTHQRRIPDPFELVNVPEPLERAVNHFIDEAARAVELGDASDEALPDPEVTAFEGDEIAMLEQALCPAGFNDAFGRESSRFRVSVNIASKIEA